MDQEPKLEKRKASDAIRLESIKRRKHERASQVKHISTALRNLDVSAPKNKKIIFDDESDKEQGMVCGSKSGRNEKMTLFDASSEDENEDYEERFKIKKQFEGERGQQLFEMSSQFTDERFKLDERFKEDDESVHSVSGSEEASNDVDEEEHKLEKEKNLEILEKVLGFQVSKKPPTDVGKVKKRKYVRFDPESENASDYIRKQDERQKDELKTKEKVADERLAKSSEPVVSTERFFEVASNLKEVLDTADEQFNLSQKFKLFPESNDEQSASSQLSTGKDGVHQNSTSNEMSCQSNFIDTERNDSLHERINAEKNDDVEMSSGEAKTRRTFFVQANDERLKEGINFFQRTEDLDKIREQWPAIRDELVEAYKRNRKGALKFSKRR